MAQNQGFSAGGGGFLRIMGIIYLVKRIRQRREERRRAAADSRQEPTTGQ